MLAKYSQAELSAAELSATELSAAELSATELSADYGRIEAAIHYLEENFQAQPSLADIAAHIGLSEYHFQRLFSRWAGTSPKRFLQFLTIQHAKKLLANSRSILEAAYEAGLSSPSRLHDLFVTHEAITPGEFKQKGAGLTIQYGFHSSPFGECLVALTERGICGLQFVAGDNRAAALAEVQTSWPQAKFVADEAATRPFIEPIFHLSAAQERPSLPLYLKGTNFQIQVWQALLKIPVGTAVSYGNVAQFIGSPKASRAVGSAVGSNPIAYLIPCHRVIQQAGKLGDYRWGSSRKKAILAWESARFSH